MYRVVDGWLGLVEVGVYNYQYQCQRYSECARASLFLLSHLSIHRLGGKNSFLGGVSHEIRKIDDKNWVLVFPTVI